jgi:AcrR family transcriptional regulator
MSTSNLQYHYRTRDEIIRAIYELMFSEFELIYAGVDQNFGAETLRALLQKNFELIWKYRFFYREYAALLRNDPMLSERFKAVQETRIAQQEALISLLAGRRRGISQPVDPAAIRNVVLIGWLLGNTWLSYVESTGRKIDETVLKEAVEMMALHYKPYLSE